MDIFSSASLGCGLSRLTLILYAEPASLGCCLSRLLLILYAEPASLGCFCGIAGLILYATRPMANRPMATRISGARARAPDWCRQAKGSHRAGSHRAGSLRHKHALKRSEQGAWPAVRVEGRPRAERGSCHEDGGRRCRSCMPLAKRQSETIETYIRARDVRRAAQVRAATGASRSQRAEHIPVPLARRCASACRNLRRCRRENAWQGRARGSVTPSPFHPFRLSPLSLVPLTLATLVDSTGVRVWR